MSLCLENQPEAAAIIGNRPVMVTSGATPLEGLPGLTSCGELDGGIVIALAQKKLLPEQINHLLTQESGLVGLVGRKTSWREVFHSEEPEAKLAREVVQYRMLQVAGAAAAAMGGLDVIIFSGRWAALASVLGPYLTWRLPAGSPPFGCRATWRRLRTPLNRIIADVAMAEILHSDVAWASRP